MPVEAAACLHCGKLFYPKIGERFCSPSHAREYFGSAAILAGKEAEGPETATPGKTGQFRTRLAGSNTSRRVMALLNLQTPGPDPSFCRQLQPLPPFAGSSYPPSDVDPPTGQEALPLAAGSPWIPLHQAVIEPSSLAAEPPGQRPSSLPLLPPRSGPAPAPVQPAAAMKSEELTGIRRPVLARAGFQTPEASAPAAKLFALTRGVESIRTRCPAANTRMRLESVTPWLVPQRPMSPAWNSEPRKFDWAQLIARLADFETSKFEAMKPTGSKTNSSMRIPVAKPRPRTIPMVGPAVAFWQSQSWAVRSMTLAIPLLAFIAVKPSLDGTFAKPVVLAKEMPPPTSTAVRMIPSKLHPTEKRITESAPPPDAVEPAPQPPAGGSEPPPRPDTRPHRNTPKTDIPNSGPKLTNLDRMLLGRAAVELVDDFSFGLDSWDSRGANGAAWTYDRTGFIRPRGLSLFRPSMTLSDYSVEFLAKIDQTAVSWVVRAYDYDNYVAVKLVQKGNGPIPRYSLIRYSVLQGKESSRVERPLPLNLYKDTLFRIRMDIRGSNFAVLMQDTVVEAWTDERFPFGGVGFFTGRGEESRIRWVQVTYQNDLLGKICAWLAPKHS